jgi:anaerobic magnesium-protoporphyrin IX monomethyl ester cyclase
MSSILQGDGHHVNIILFKAVSAITPNDVPPPEKHEDGGYYSMATYTTPLEIQLLLQTLEQQDPHLIGISFTSISHGLAVFVTQKIKEKFNVPVIWGGVDTTVNPNENIHYTDMVCIGEGEYPIRQLVNALDKGNDITHIPSIWVKEDGVVHKNAINKLEQNLDSYPFPDYEIENKTVIFEGKILPSHLPPYTHLFSNFMIMATRGCPFSCTYCCSGHYRQIYKGQKYLRRRSVDNVIEELNYRKKTWPNPLERIEIYDDVLPLDRKWLSEFAPKYASEIGLPFFGYTHPNVGDPENLKILKQAGISYLIMGIQSGSQRVLNDYYHRRHTKKRVLQTAQNIVDSDIHLLCDFIGYNPLIKEEDNIETIDLICDLPRGFGIIHVNPMAFYDNYQLTHIAKENQIMDQLERPKGVHAWQAKITPELTFWAKMHLLAHFKGFSKQHILDITQDHHMRANPDFLTQYTNTMYQATYQDGNPAVPKDLYIQNLQQTDIRYPNSKMLHAYKKARSLVA